MSPDSVVIVPYRDGPYLVRGPVVLRDQDGGEIDANRRTVALCRCGKSKMRPFCDGTHHLVRFRAASGPETPLLVAPPPVPAAPDPAVAVAVAAPAPAPEPPAAPAHPLRRAAAAALRRAAARIDHGPVRP